MFYFLSSGISISFFLYFSTFLLSRFAFWVCFLGLLSGFAFGSAFLSYVKAFGVPVWVCIFGLHLFPMSWRFLVFRRLGLLSSGSAFISYVWRLAFGQQSRTL
jgi:hypothetical protein